MINCPDLLEFFENNLAILFVCYVFLTFFMQGAFTNFRKAVLFCNGTAYEFVQRLQRILELSSRYPFEAIKRYRATYAAFCNLFPLAFEMVTTVLPFCFIMFIVCSNALIFAFNSEQRGAQIIISFYIVAWFDIALTIFTLGCWILSNSESIHRKLKRDQIILRVGLNVQRSILKMTVRSLITTKLKVSSIAYVCKSYINTYFKVMLEKNLDSFLLVRNSLM